MNLDLRTIFLMDAALYLMLHGAIWIGLARYRSAQVALWSAAGMLSAVGLVFLGLRGVLPEWSVAVFGQTLMALGNWGRQTALRSMVGLLERRWLWQQGVFNLAYLTVSLILFALGASDAALVLLFFAFYTLNLTEYFRIGRDMRRAGLEHGPLAIEAAAAAFCISLGIKTVALAAGWGEVDLYVMAWDQGVVFVGQFVAISLVNVGFIQVFVDRMHKARLKAEQDVVLQQQKTQLLEQHALELGKLVREREEIIRQLTLSSKTAGMGALVASIAHEINQPLTTIVLKAELVDAHLQSSGNLESARELCRQIVADSHKAGSIIRTVRNMFNVSKGQFETFDFSVLVRDIVAIVRGRAERQGLVLESHLGDPIHLTGDVTQLQQVVLNLLNNAIVATSDAGVADPHIRVDCRIELGHAELAVWDNGHGIAPEQHPDVFALFKSPLSKHMGVGLWLSQAIVQSHGGQLRFECKPGQGTVFLLRLPILHDLMLS